MAVKGIEKCNKAGVETSIACCLTNRNSKYVEEMLELTYRLGVQNIRFNIYKPVHNDGLILSYDQFWNAMEVLFISARLISCSEPIVNAILGIKILDGGCPCGKASLRVRPDGRIIPCVYWPKSDLSIWDIMKRGEEALLKSQEFHRIGLIPEECKGCKHLEICKGGCASRRVYHNLSEPDEYCHIQKGVEAPRLRYEPSQTKDLVHSNYLCTLIFSIGE